MDQKPLTVTVHDPATGETATREVRPGDYAVITCAPCYVSRTEVFPRAGTHVLTVKGWKPAGAPQPARPVGDGL